MADRGRLQEALAHGDTRLHEALGCVDPDELIALTRDLVRIPSVVKPGDPDGNEAAVADHVRRWLAKEGFEVAVDLVAPSRPNVVAWLGAAGAGRCLLLEGHTDVVTEGDHSAWSHPPFGGDLVDGRIWGRGAADMKGGLAAAMIAAAAIKRAGARFRGRLVVGALVDEEGDMLGARRFAATALARELTAAIICEPEQNELCLEQRGVVWARVGVRGRMAHGAMPEAGVNPLTAVAALLREVPRLERRLRRLCGRSRYLRPPTVTPTVVRGPAEGLPQSNVIPAYAEVVLDVRLTPGPDAEAVSAEIDRACRAAAESLPGVVVEWRPVNGFRSATRVPRDEPLVRAMASAVRTVTGRAPLFGGVPGSTDGTILRETLGIPIVTCGPGHRLIPHQADEHVTIAELVDAARIYVASTLNYLEGMSDGSSGSAEYPRLRAVEAFPVDHEGERLIALRDPAGYAPSVVVLPSGVVEVVALMDGSHSFVDIQAELMRRHGELVPRAQLEELVESLDAHGFMESARFGEHRAAIDHEFLAAPVRPASHAGGAYAAEPDELRRAMDGFFAHPEGPGPIEWPAAPRGGVAGGIAPHIDFHRGGPAYAWAYRRLAERCDGDLFVIFGTCHAGMREPFALTRKDYATPFGLAPVDREFVEALAARAGQDCFASELAHRGEHSIEFQAVFLRYLYAGRRDITIVPILASFAHEALARGRGPEDDPRVPRFLDAVAELAAASRRRVVVLAGADLAHVGPRFGDEAPVSAEDLGRIEREDREMLTAVEAGDPRAFFDAIAADGDRRRICGYSPIYATLRVLGRSRGELHRYGQWPDPEGVVTFASVTFERA